jgi:putative ABC transport system ATP-binding protein
MQPILIIENVLKSFGTGDKKLNILSNINLEIESGSMNAIVGPSGSGKTTLLGLCAGLDKPTEGKILFNNIELNKQNEDELAQLRNENTGFIFQNFQLIPTLTALENVMVPLELNRQKNAREIANDLLEKVGLGDRLDHYPVQLSGGEQQRVSIARAFANKPTILFADEPTGNLDAETSEKIVNLLFELNKESGTTLIMVTHDLELAAKCQRIIQIKGGKIISDLAVNHNE